MQICIRVGMHRPKIAEDPDLHRVQIHTRLGICTNPRSTLDLNLQQDGAAPTLNSPQTAPKPRSELAPLQCPCCNRPCRAIPGKIPPRHPSSSTPGPPSAHLVVLQGDKEVAGEGGFFVVPHGAANYAGDENPRGHLRDVIQHVLQILVDDEGHRNRVCAERWVKTTPKWQI